MADNSIVVRCTIPHFRGGHIAGESGVVYWVNPESGNLHAIDGQSPSAEAGVPTADAVALLAFPGYQRVSAPPVAARAASAAPAAPVPEEPKPAPEPEPKPDLSALDGSVASLSAKLASGELDHLLDDLLAAEQAGKTRKTAVEAITERMTER